MFDLLVKTMRGLEKITASRILEVIESSEVIPKPHGFLGLVLVKKVPMDKYEAAKVILNNVEEAEKVLVIEGQSKARIDDIVNTVTNVVKGKILSNETFAVRTTRRGIHDFTSIDVNVAVGAKVKEVTGAEVDLDFPQKIVWVEILQDRVYISVTTGELEHRKVYEGKPMAFPILKKITIAQVPYIGPLGASRKMGVRIGRAVQAFEIRELYITPFKPVPADELKAFLEGIFEGINSRYEIQKRTYPRKVHKVPVYVQDLYQFVRDRRGENIIATSTRGKSINELKDKIAEIFKKNERVNVLIGAREGLPTATFRYSTITVDLAPSITISTEFASVAAIIALITVLEEYGLLPRYHKRKKVK